MATSNRERIDQGFQVLQQGLLPFVDEVMSANAPSGRDWVEMLDARNNHRRGTSFTNSKDDPRFLLTVITDEWRLFRDKLSRGEQSFASELRETGNKLAHGEKFSADDAYRALDTMERLLAAVDAHDQAGEVRKIRRDSQQAQFASATRKAVQAVTGVEGAGLKPWREVIVPHKDVRDGNMRGAEFAADLHYVTHGEASREYLDPVEFFRRTYLTDGLRDLLTWCARRITGDMNAPPVVNLQTNFGGGKTHSMLALWHLLSDTPLTSFTDELQHLLSGVVTGPLPEAQRAVIVGNHTPAGKGSVKPDGTHVMTLWGELAWQLGHSAGGEAEARRAYEIVQNSDETRSNPGSALGDLIKQYSPCLILIDEWVAYARQLYGREDLAGGTFDTQFTFAQTLTEAVKATPGAMLLVSIPASSAEATPEEKERGATDIEVGGHNGREALARLQQAIRRVADSWRPASAVESFRIVRQRLFEEPSADAQVDIAAVARTFVEFYARNRPEFPSGVAELSYEERITAAYPIHPELFDRLYEEWSTLERFQRTRGVLRLMSAVIHTLWAKDDPAPLIMPGGIPFDSDEVQSEITQYLEDRFKPVIDADIDADTATPAQIDESRATLGQRRVTRRIARSIFFGSAATLKAAHRGVEQPRIWLGIATPGDTIGNFSNALHLLSDRATYLYSEGARYWYDTAPSIQKMARDQADRLKDRPEETWEEILRRLRDQEQRTRGMFARVQIGPDRSDDIPDEAAVRLIVMHPSMQHSRGNLTSAASVFASAAAQGRGTAHRLNRNMVVFLAPDSKRYDELDDVVRQYLAWNNLVGTPDKIRELDLPPQQAAQAAKRLKDTDETVNLRISGAYHWILVPMQSATGGGMWIEELKADTARERLSERASIRLKNADMLRDVQGPSNIRMNLRDYLSSVWSEGHIAVGKLWEYYCQYPYLPRLADRSVLDEGIRHVFSQAIWEQDGFAVASGYDKATGQYQELALPAEDVAPPISDTTLLVEPSRAIAQREAERAKADADRAAVAADAAAATRSTVPSGDGAENGVSSAPAQGGFAPADGGSAPSTPKNTRFYGVYHLNPERYAKDITKVSQEVIQHLAAQEGVDLEVTVEISAKKRDGFPDSTVRIVSENARTLKFEDADFEDQ